MATTTRRLQPTRPTITSLLPTDQTPGRSVTVGDFIIEQVNAGVDPVTAAQTAGVAPPEFLAWMREGALTLAKLNAGGDWGTDFTPEQQDCHIFADKLNRAHAAHIARLAVVAEQLARGGVEKVTVRSKRVGKAVVEETRIVERTLPDPGMVQWKLEKLEPAVYGQKATMNVTVVDLTDTQDVANVMEQRMADIAAALGNTQYPNAIETTARTTDDDDD